MMTIQFCDILYKFLLFCYYFALEDLYLINLPLVLGSLMQIINCNRRKPNEESFYILIKTIFRVVLVSTICLISLKIDLDVTISWVSVFIPVWISVFFIVLALMIFMFWMSCLAFAAIQNTLLRQKLFGSILFFLLSGSICCVYCFIYAIIMYFESFDRIGIILSSGLCFFVFGVTALYSHFLRVSLL